MSKVNLLWEKARRAGLAEGKLERLYSKLKVQDKDELTMKKLKTEGGDKDGIKDAFGKGAEYLGRVYRRTYFSSYKFISE